MEKLHHRAQTRGTAPAGGNSLREFNRLSEGCQTLNDAGTRGRWLGGVVSEDKMWFQVHFLQKQASRTLRPSWVSFPYHRRLWADQIRRPGTFQRGRPPPPGPELGFLLSPGETATPGTPGFHSSVGGAGGIRLNLQRLIWTPVPPRNSPKTNIVEDQLLPASSH